MLERLIGVEKKTTALLRQADQFRDAHKWAEAASAYEAYLKHRSSDAPIWVQFGHAVKEAGDPALAETAYRRAIEIDPNNSDTFLQLGHALKLLGRLNEATQAYTQSIRLDPDCRDAQLELRQFGWGTDDVTALLDEDTVSDIPTRQDSRLAVRSRLSAFPQEKLASFDSKAYRQQFDDVNLLIRLGVVESAIQHYIHYGYRQGRDVLATFEQKPPSCVFVLCPSFFKRCGIGEHARYLADSIEKSGLKTYRIRSTRELIHYPDQVLQDAVLIVNHGPGLFDGYNPELSEGETTTDLLSTLLGLFKMHNLRPILFMHSLLDRDNEVMFPRQQLALEFPIPVATTIEAAARVFNIFRVEHGLQPVTVPAQRSIEGIPRPRDYPTIGFFGFFQWGGKNFEALFSVAKSLKAKLVGSIATREEAQVDSLRQMLNEREIHCNIGTGWVEDSELAQRLAEADFHYLPQHDYDHWNNSGTARFVMNFGRPVIVPPHNPFLDLRKSAIFADEHDLPSIMAGLRDNDTYQSACQRTRNYAQAHPMLEEMPRLATALHRTASNTGADNFLEPSLFSAYRLISAPSTVFVERISHATGQPFASIGTSPGEPASAERVAAIDATRAKFPGTIELDYPVVEPIQYWRDHYEISDFVGLSGSDTCFAVYRCILKREPTLAEFHSCTDLFRLTRMAKSRPAVRQVFAILAKLLKRRIALDFAPAVQLYHQGNPVDAADLGQDEIIEFHQSRSQVALELVARLAPTHELRFGSLADKNLIGLLALPAPLLEMALETMCRQKTGQLINFKGVGRYGTILETYAEISQRLGQAGLRVTDVFLIDEPISSPVHLGRRSYSLSEFMNLEGDAFIINIVRCLLKREPTIEEMFLLGKTLDSHGKKSAIDQIMEFPNLNASIIDIMDTSSINSMEERVSDTLLLQHQFRSPTAGGWDDRNIYLETKRNFARQWLYAKRQKEIWWDQSGHNIGAIVS